MTDIVELRKHGAGVRTVREAEVNVKPRQSEDTSNTVLIREAYERPWKMKKDLPTAIDLTKICKTAGGYPHLSKQTHVLNLPDEVLISIFQYTKRPLDQIALLLSCKKTASLFSGITLNHFEKGISTGGRYIHIAYAHRHLVTDMVKWTRFIPVGTQFYYGCEKFLPMHRIWKNSKGRDITSLRNVDWMWAISSWTKETRTKTRKICPTCQISEDFKDGKDWLQAWPEGFGRRLLVRQPLLKK